MFLYRVKVEELDNVRLASLQNDLAAGLGEDDAIREMSVVADGAPDHRALDIYLALDDIIGGEQFRRLVAKLHAFLDFDFKPGKTAQRPRISSELIHI
ncbi:MAG: hypothetical protein WDN03_18240 [Rhizomicrobium sp.]